MPLDQTEYSFSEFDRLVQTGSMIFYVLDILCDVALAINFYFTGEHQQFYFTIAIICLSWALMSIYSTYRYYKEYRYKTGVDYDYRIYCLDEHWCSYYAIRIMLGCVFLAPCVRYYDVRKFVGKGISERNADKREYLYKEAQEERSCGGVLNLMEGTLEAAPQAAVQSAFLLTATYTDTYPIQLVLSVARFIVALLSVAWRTVAITRANRLNRPDKKELSYLGMGASFLWRICESGSRLISLGMLINLFAAHQTMLFLVPVGIHWLLMFIWIRLLQTNVCGDRKSDAEHTESLIHRISDVESAIVETLAAAVFGIVWVYGYYTMKDGPTLTTIVPYYAVFFIENGAITSMWFNLSDVSSSVKTLVLLINLCLIVVAIAMAIVYYKLFHPTIFSRDDERRCTGRCRLCC